ncbi:MAG: DUF6644 family protein [Acidobacteriota bacterium]|nr:hypothetical protein [Acidobacteriota bacterium]MEE3104039.1 DUF6644 family protein [Acidobacteriota bacterium]|tara:strand:- start:562 stop:1059 length:498 start_codon:yes stop_codon:yes gene_type:complete
MSPLEFFEWLQNTDWSIAIRESLLLYPLIETTHVLALCVSVGLIAIVDLRLIGLSFSNVLISEVTGKLIPWALVGFTLMVTSGLLLFYANPLKASQNLFFQIKMVALLLAGLNAFFFHAVIYRKATTWDSLQIVPFRARLAGCASLTLWTAVLVSGRLQAFNWFN